MTTLQTETFEGVPGGMNLAFPPQEIDDTECRYLQDGLVDYPGLVRRRGPVRKVAGLAALDLAGTGLVMALNPLGTDKYGALIGDAANGYLAVLSDDLTTKTNLTWPHPLPTSPPSPPYRVVDAKPALLGGLMIGVSSAYDANSPNQGLAFWVGGNKANYAAASVTVARGSSAVTAASGFNANVAPGMWMFANTDDPFTSALIGLVRSVNSDTSITLAAISPYNVTAKAATFQSLRGIAPKVVKGRITCDTNAATVTGGQTKFLSQGVNTGVWQIYRASDMTFVGKVTSVQSEFALTLTANAAVAMADSAYVAIRADADFNIVTTANTQKVGWINAPYVDRQWYANNGAQFEKTSRVWFSDSSDPEALDLSSFDGDWIDVTSSATINEPIRAVVPAQNGLLVFKENETFIISGNSPASFAVRKLEDDGALIGMSAQPWAGGVIWAGREGIHHYDGIQVHNLTTPKLGDYWKNTVRTLNPATYRMWSMIDRDHYHLFLENIAPTVPVVKGSVAATPTRYTIVINMSSRAITIDTNVNIRGAVTLPASSGKAMWYLVNGLELDSAATFGTTSPGVSQATLIADNKWAVKKAANATSTVAALRFRLDGAGAGISPVGQLRAAIYADSAGSPGAKLAESRSVIITKGAPATDVVFTLTTPLAVTNGTNYWLTIHAGSGADIARIYYTSNPASAVTNLDVFSDGGADPFGSISSSALDMTGYAVLGVNHGFICEGEALFNEEGVDPITCDQGTAGPDFYLETKKFFASDSLRLKRFKQFTQEYLVQGGDIKVDTVLGYNDIGTTLGTSLPGSGYTWDSLRSAISTWDGLKNTYPTWAAVISALFVPKRIRFMKKSQALSFRLWQSSNLIARLRLGPYGLGYKIQRVGRV